MHVEYASSGWQEREMWNGSGGHEAMFQKSISGHYRERVCRSLCLCQSEIHMHTPTASITPQPTPNLIFGFLPEIPIHSPKIRQLANRRNPSTDTVDP